MRLDLHRASLACEARDRLLLLKIEADACAEFEYHLARHRAKRDALALRLVDAGYSWRDVAAVAGFANTYIAALKRRSSAVTGEDPS